MTAVQANSTSSVHVTFDLEKGIVNGTADIAASWEPSWDNFQTSIVRFEIEPTATGSRLTILHNGFDGREAMARPHAEGWERVLGWLDAYVTR